MSNKSERVCDHCGQSSADPQVIHWPTIRIHAVQGFRTGSVVDRAPAVEVIDDLHVCQGCLPALATFFPKAKIAIEQLAQHEATIEIKSVERIMPGASAAIILKGHDRPPASWFDISRLVIAERPSDWVVNELRIGMRAQFAQAGDVPGDLFGPDITDAHVMFDRLRSFEDFQIGVTYIGKNPEGVRFVGKMIGTSPGFVPASKPSSTIA